MSAARAKTVGYVAGAFLALTAVVGGVALALSHNGSQPAAAASMAANHAAAQGAVPLTSSSPSPAPILTPVALKVPPLHKLTPPDAIVTMRHTTSIRAAQRLRKLPGIHQVALADRGTIRIHGVRLTALGVPLANIREFTPQLTAASNPLWKSIARGELTVGYANAKRLRRRLGNTYPTTGEHGKVAPLRIGAFATIGLNGAQALVSQPAARSVGLSQRRVALISAPKISLDALTADIRKTLGAKAHIDVTRIVPVDQSVSSSYATSTIPASYLDLYRRAAVTCPGLPWTVLAGIGTVETGNGRDVHRSTAGAEGPMQFMPSTWAMYGYDADGDGKANINDPVDAVFSAARYLCAAGAGRGGQSLDDAIFSYNHAWWYVREVIVIANQYA